VAIDENNNERVVALGEYNEPKNNSRMLQRIPEPKSPTLFIIQWNENGKTSYNHFVSGKNPISIETWKLWCERINKIL
jgi:hypothetical protein